MNLDLDRSLKRISIVCVTYKCVLLLIPYGSLSSSIRDRSRIDKTIVCFPSSPDGPDNGFLSFPKASVGIQARFQTCRPTVCVCVCGRVFSFSFSLLLCDVLRTDGALSLPVPTTINVYTCACPCISVCVGFVQDRLLRRGRRQVGMRGGHSQSSFALSPS